MRTVGLLGTKGTVQGGGFQRRLLEGGISTRVPELVDQERVMSAIYKIKGIGADSVKRESKEIMIDISNQLLLGGSEGIIAGCTEISLVLEPEDITSPLFDPLLILARAAIKEALGK
jgi:aspartate racemase